MQKSSLKKNKFFVFSLLCIIFLTGISQNAKAMIVEDLYTVELTALNKTELERQALFSKGFEQVLFKLTDGHSLLTEPRIKAAQEQIDKYVSSFAYINNSENDLQVKIIFNETMIDSLLQAAGKAYLGKNRPIILVWLMLDTGHGIKPISEDEYDTFVPKLEQIAANHAIPLMLPLLDLDEQSKINVDEILNGSPAVLADAAAKYNADVVLVGKVTNFSGVWQTNWNILGDSSAPLAWETKGTTMEEQYNQLMNTLKARLINRYVSNANTQEKVATDVVILKVSGVGSLENYSKILTYLRGLTAVSLVKVIGITNNDVTFELQASGGENAIKQAISMERFLEQSTFLDDNISSELHVLHYKVCS